MLNDNPPSRRVAAKARDRRGQSLVEFAVIALVLYLLLAVIIEFGRAMWVSQTVQSAADVMAREIARTPLPPAVRLEEVISNNQIPNVYSEAALIIDITDQPANQTLFDYLDTLDVPIVNKMLAPVMIISRIGDRTYLRYPGAVIQPDGGGGPTVQVPIVVERGPGGVETIAWRRVVEPMTDQGNDMFSVASVSPNRGVVALRINYPFQAAAMTAHAPVPNGSGIGNLNQPILADDAGVMQINDPIGTPIGTDAGGDYGGPYGGVYGLGELGALGTAIRPFRSVITAQAVARREVFGSSN